MVKKSQSNALKPKRQKARKLSPPATIEVDLAKLPIEVDPSLRIVWSDYMQVFLRSDTPVVMLRFYSSLPDRLIEAARVQTSTAHLQRMLDALCRTIDYYPVREE